MTGQGAQSRRRVRGLAAGVLLAVLAVTACDRPSAPADESDRFSHALGEDISGYYRPVEPVRIGAWSLGHVFIGQTAAFETWEGGQPDAAFAPVMLEFEGADERTIRVLPTSYAVTPTRVRFEGRSPDLGPVAFEGRLDPAALATARRNLGDEAAVLTGTLSVGGVIRPSVRLRWWMGD